MSGNFTWPRWVVDIVPDGTRMPPPMALHPCYHARTARQLVKYARKRGLVARLRRMGRRLDGRLGPLNEAVIFTRA